MNKKAKAEFVDAYRYLFGGTKKAAEKVYKTADVHYINACIEAFERNAKVSFYYD